MSPSSVSTVAFNAETVGSNALTSANDRDGNLFLPNEVVQTDSTVQRVSQSRETDICKDAATRKQPTSQSEIERHFEHFGKLRGKIMENEKAADPSDVDDTQDDEVVVSVSIPKLQEFPYKSLEDADKARRANVRKWSAAKAPFDPTYPTTWMQEKIYVMQLVQAMYDCRETHDNPALLASWKKTLKHSPNQVIQGACAVIDEVKAYHARGGPAFATSAKQPSYKGEFGQHVEDLCDTYRLSKTNAIKLTSSFNALAGLVGDPSYYLKRTLNNKANNGIKERRRQIAIELERRVEQETSKEKDDTGDEHDAESLSEANNHPASNRPLISLKSRLEDGVSKKNGGGPLQMSDTSAETQSRDFQSLAGSKRRRETLSQVEPQSIKRPRRNNPPDIFSDADHSGTMFAPSPLTATMAASHSFEGSFLPAEGLFDSETFPPSRLTGVTQSAQLNSFGALMSSESWEINRHSAIFDSSPRTVQPPRSQTSFKQPLNMETADDETWDHWNDVTTGLTPDEVSDEKSPPRKDSFDFIPDVSRYPTPGATPELPRY